MLLPEIYKFKKPGWQLLWGAIKLCTQALAEKVLKASQGYHLPWSGLLDMKGVEEGLKLIIDPMWE